VVAHGGIERDVNIISDLVDADTRLVVQKLLEGEQADYGEGATGM